MRAPIPNTLWNQLLCSSCGSELTRAAEGVVCTGCGNIYSFSPSGALDLRPKAARTYRLELSVGQAPVPYQDFHFSPLSMNPKPEIDFGGVPVPRHLTRQMLSYFPRAKAADSLMLDLGCGDGIHRQVCERAGYQWVGLDYESPGAQILGDAHTLPFKDLTFEFLLCITVLQYTRFPLVAMREAYRVLRPGGVILGTVAFLEPSHGQSFYHHTDLGTFNALHQAGFRPVIVAPSEEWTVFRALANMGLFYGMPKPLAEAIVWPLQYLHQLWWWAGGLATRRDLRERRIRNFTGSFTFIATKEDAWIGK